MARNRDLAAEDPAVPTDAVEGTTALVTGDAQPPPNAASAEAPSPRVVRYTVAKGRAIGCLPGTIRATQSIRAMDLAGGAEQLAELVKSGDVDEVIVDQA